MVSMPQTLTLHVGTPKSGTTHLQAALRSGRDRLRRLGTLYPGAGYLPQDGFNQQPAVYALAGRTIGWVDDAVRQNAAIYFARLCEEVSAHPGRVLVSAESLAFFEPPEARSLLESLSFEPSAVTVVITARDFGRILPSVWQQNVKNGSTEALGPYLDSVASLRDRPGVPFWTAFDLPRLVGRWSEIVGLDRVVLVTAPPPGADRGTLWSRYAAAASLPETLAAATSRRADDNLAVTRSQAELLRGLSLAMQAHGYPKDRQQRVRAEVLQIWMDRAPHSTQERLLLPQHLRKDVDRWADEDIFLLRRMGVRVVGALTDLAPVWTPVTGAAASSRGTIDVESVDPDTPHDVLAILEHLTRPRSPRSVLGEASPRRGLEEAWWRRLPGAVRARALGNRAVASAVPADPPVGAVRVAEARLELPAADPVEASPVQLEARGPGHR
jgi:hypothetical protein